MVRRYASVAIAYDFDGTLSPGNMQEHGFIPNIGISKRTFWDEADRLAKENNADSVLTYMNLMLKKASEKGISTTRQEIVSYGMSVKLFPGVKEWFARINDFGKSLNLNIEHYIISSGLHEIIDGTPIAKEFKKIYASSFKYDENDAAEWPALAINFTTKTQYLFRINKGALDVFDTKKINQYVPMEERPIPFQRIIFLGDGDTDIPCFSLVKSMGGHSIAIYKPKTHGARERAQKLVKDRRVNFIAPANYSKASTVDRIISTILRKIAEDNKLSTFTKDSQPKP